MHITAEEKLMYKVMKAIYDSSIPVSFKGSMVLKACLLESGYSEDTRHTVDIDANWNSDITPTAAQMIQSLQQALKNSNIDLQVELFRPYGEKQSAGFDLKEPSTGEVLFSMDVDVNRSIPQTKIYEVDGLRFRGVLPSQMIADKISAVSSDKVFRRVKDVVDLYYFSKVFDFDQKEIMLTIKNSHRTLGSFQGFLYRVDDLRHSYAKFRFEGGVNKPAFDEVYDAAKTFIKDILPKDQNV